MSPKPKRAANSPVTDFRHDDAKRKNNPPAGLAAQGRLQDAAKLRYSYDAHLPPVLRSDATGASDRARELLAAAQERRLSPEEANELAELLRNREPWLEWTGKREEKSFVVDPVALHIHERVSTQAIVRAVQRKPKELNLFADPQQEYREAVQFYKYDVDWTNRMILGDSLQVMASLARREDLAGKVQMIYLDPPYGIKFASNFQPEIGRRDVKDKEQDLTREPEMVKAYRDTWTLGVHSYLAYLRDRLILCRELLSDSGSIFVQISDANIHRVRAVMDEVFGADNFAGLISFQKTGSIAGSLLGSTVDFLLWYARDIGKIKYRQLFEEREQGDKALDRYDLALLPNGALRRLAGAEIAGEEPYQGGSRLQLTSMLSEGQSSTPQEFNFAGRTYLPRAGSHWKTSVAGLQRLADSERLEVMGSVLRYRRFVNDFPVVPINDRWESMQVGTGLLYVVQTAPSVIARCVLMTTDPGDLVLDPTCGSGTTAYVAEQWGRRWITADTSRVALALARQRLMTATYPHYRVRQGDGTNPANNFVYKSVPHITLRSIAQNLALDGIVARHAPILASRLSTLNAALGRVDAGTRQRLAQKLAAKQKQEGKRAITEADRRRWDLPAAWREWEVPFDSDNDWPDELRNALAEYRAAWRDKMDDVNAAISASAEEVELVDQPDVVKNVTRVSGPFTVEAVMPAEQSLDDNDGFDGAPDELASFETDGRTDVTLSPSAPAGTESFRDTMLRLLRQDGVRFPDNREMHFASLEPTPNHLIHAQGEWANGDGNVRRVAVSFGPEHGPITAYQVEEALRAANRGGYDDLVFAGFSFDAAAQATIQDDPNPRVRCHLAHIAPSVQMGDLLKATPSSQLFTVFGQPRTELRSTGDGHFIVKMEGVDIYDPVQNTIHPTRADKVAAWFVDSDYDGRTFCVTQAFFPDRSAWEKIARALKGTLDESAWEALTGTESLPFPLGSHRRVAVKVIDPRGNEVMRVHRLDDEPGY